MESKASVRHCHSKHFHIIHGSLFLSFTHNHPTQMFCLEIKTILIIYFIFKARGIYYTDRLPEPESWFSPGFLTSVYQHSSLSSGLFLDSLRVKSGAEYTTESSSACGDTPGEQHSTLTHKKQSKVQITNMSFVKLTC